MVPKKPLKSKTPAISVIMPAYNAEKYIASAIDSILLQTFKDFELIIVDDSSTDKTWDIVKKYIKGKRIIASRNNKNLKLSKTLNAAIEKSRGKYLARMDADDWSYPNRLDKQYKFMEKYKNVGIVGGQMEIVKEDGTSMGKRRYAKDDKSLRKNIFWFSPFSHPLIMIRKSILDRVGMYNPQFNPAEDYELYFRIGKISKFANLPETLLKYRVIAKSMTTGSTKKMELQTIKIRNMYANSKEYKMTHPQRIYNILQLISTHIVPSPLKMKIFNYLRNSRI